MNGIFVSYRRTDTLDITARICDRLKAEFSNESIFVDFSTLLPGSPFPLAIDKWIRRSGVVIMVIGRNWNRGTQNSQDSQQDSRLGKDSADWVRTEIETALSCGIPLIPVLVHGTNMLGRHELPDSIKTIAGLHAIEVSSTNDFEDHVRKLIECIKEHISSECLNIASRPVKLIDVNDSLKNILHLVYEEDFSQFPVIDGTEFKGLLTENGITHWLADFCSRESETAINTADIQVRDLLKFQEPVSNSGNESANFKFIPTKTLADDAIQLFYTNPVLEALLLTDDGNPHIEIQGIITQWGALEYKQPKI